MQKKLTPFKVEWKAHEHEYKERSSDWFWAVGIVALSIAIVSVIFSNIIFAILVMVACFALALFINREPDTIEITVTERGITKGNVHYPYDALDSFWIETDHPHKKLFLCSRKPYLPLIIVPLGDTDPENLADALLDHLPERYHSPPLVERLLEYLGF